MRFLDQRRDFFISLEEYRIASAIRKYVEPFGNIGKDFILQ